MFLHKRLKYTVFFINLLKLSLLHLLQVICIMGLPLSYRHYATIKTIYSDQCELVQSL